MLNLGRAWQVPRLKRRNAEHKSEFGHCKIRLNPKIYHDSIIIKCFIQLQRVWEVTQRQNWNTYHDNQVDYRAHGESCFIIQWDA